MSEPWQNSSYPLDGDCPRSKLHQHLQSDSSSETSGYSSTSVSGYSSFRPCSRHSLSRTRDSLALSHDEGSTINNIFINYSPRLMQSPFELECISRHSDVISSRNAKLLHEFAPQLVNSMDALALLPYLMRYGLANRHDQEVISNPNTTSLEKNMYIIQTAPFKDSNAFERFVKCLEEVGNEFASQLRQRITISSPLTSPGLGLERVDDTTVLDEDDLRDVKSAVADLSGKWKDLGISLGICSSKLDGINSPSASDCLREMLALWLRQNYNVQRFGKPTWRRLAEAVKDDSGGNNPALAQTITRDHSGLPFTAADSGKKEDKQILPKNVETVSKQVQGIAQQQVTQSQESAVQTERKLDDSEPGSRNSDTLSEQMKLSMEIKSLEAEIEKLRRQLDHDKPKSSFLGVEVVGEEKLMVTNEGMNFQWKAHGFELHVPKNALPEGIPEYSVNIRVSLAGQFELPEGYELVSAVYWVQTPGKFEKPTTIQLQHCANFSNPNQLCFVRTSCAQKSLPYKFTVIDGGTFTLGNKYGALSTTHFSGNGIAKKVEPNEHSCQYCAQVYFTDKHLKDYLYYCHFVVTKDLEMCLTVVKKKYQQEYDIAPPITFGGDEVALDIPDDGTKTDNGWEIVPVQKAQIKKDRVDNFSSERTWVPECVLLLEWKQKDKDPETLKYKVKLKGTREESDFFRIVYNPATESTQKSQTERKGVPLSVTHQKKQDAEDSPESPQDKLKSGGKPTLPQLLNFPGKSGEINIPEKIGTHYKTFGIFLLNDDNGAKVESIAKEEGESMHISLKILSKWLQGEGMQPPTWRTIIEALKMSNLGALAEDIRAVIES